jgi:hypothetical protein
MAEAFKAAYGPHLAKRRERGEIGDVDALLAVMVATRWFFYFYTVERCFGMPMHFGVRRQKATNEFIHLLRQGLLPRPGSQASSDRSFIRWGG